MKRKTKVWLIVLGVFVVLVGAMAITAFSGMSAVRNAVVSSVDLSKIPDGTWPGSYAKGRFQFSVNVEVRGGRIEAVNLMNKTDPTGTAPAMAAAIVEKQSPAIDAVSGASLTTKAFAKAVENALLNAK